MPIDKERQREINREMAEKVDRILNKPDGTGSMNVCTLGPWVITTPDLLKALKDSNELLEVLLDAVQNEYGMVAKQLEENRIAIAKAENR